MPEMALLNISIMARVSNLIGESIKDRLKEVTSKPKRRIITRELIASSDDTIETKCREIRWQDHQDRMTQKCVYVLFLCGQPVRRLTKDQAREYQEIGARVEKLTLNEIKKYNL